MDRTDSDLIVSVIAITYNHEKYIKQALESIVNQTTNFKFEVIVADDCSTDDTQNIIRNFSKTYPDLIIPILREKNIGPQKNFKDAIMRARGKYIALCEGDDFWTDTSKLQSQVEYFQSHHGTSLCFHPVNVFYEGVYKQKNEIYPPAQNNSVFTLEELLKWNYIQTNSVMYKKQDYSNLPIDILPLDHYLHLMHAKNGKIGFIDRTMSAYRRHPGGLWWDEGGKTTQDLLKKHGVPMAAMYAELYTLFKGNIENEKSIFYRLNDLLNQINHLEQQNNTGLIQRMLSVRPYLVESFLIYQIKELIEREKIIHQQEKNIEDLVKNTQHLESSLIQTQQKLEHSEHMISNRIHKFIKKNITSKRVR